MLLPLAYPIRYILTVELLHRSVTGSPALIDREAQGNAIVLLGNTGFGRVRLRGQVHFGLDGNQPGFQQAQLVVEAPLSRDMTARAAYDIDGPSQRINGVAIRNAGKRPACSHWARTW